MGTWSPGKRVWGRRSCCCSRELRGLGVQGGASGPCVTFTVAAGIDLYVLFSNILSYLWKLYMFSITRTSPPKKKLQVSIYINSIFTPTVKFLVDQKL